MTEGHQSRELALLVQLLHPSWDSGPLMGKTIEQRLSLPRTHTLSLFTPTCSSFHIQIHSFGSIILHHELHRGEIDSVCILMNRQEH